MQQDESYIPLSAEALMGAVEGMNLECAIQKGPEEFPTDQIIVHLDPDSEGADQVLVLGLVNPLPQDEELLNAEGEKFPKLQMLQFLYPFNFETEEKHRADTSRLCHFLNSFVELPGFVASDQFSAPLYRYPILCTDGEIKANTFIVTFSMILSIIDTYTDTIKKVATGQIDLDSYLEEVKKMGES